MLEERGQTPDERERLGTNKRYAASIDRRMAEHGKEIVMRDKSPLSFTDDELGLDTLLLTRSRD